MGLPRSPHRPCVSGTAVPQSIYLSAGASKAVLHGRGDVKSKLRQRLSRPNPVLTSPSGGEHGNFAGKKVDPGACLRERMAGRMGHRENAAQVDQRLGQRHFDEITAFERRLRDEAGSIDQPLSRHGSGDESLAIIGAQ